MQESVIRALRQREGDLAVGALSVASVFSIPVVDMAFRSQIQFAVQRIVADGASDQGITLTPEQVEAMAEDILLTAEKVNQTTYQDLTAAFATANESEDTDVAAKLALLILLVRSVFAKRKKKARQAAEAMVTGAYSYGAWTGALLNGAITKTWVSQRDGQVRPSHVKLDGDTVPIDEHFIVDGVPIRFPGDPLAPIHLIINCRCYLRFGLDNL